MDDQADASADIRIGFLGFFGESADGEPLRGALMVTDGGGYPLEFHAATPVRPTRIQRTLYGDSLERYVLSELVAAPLIESVQRKPEAIVANRLAVLDLLDDASLIFVAAADGYVTLSHHESKLLDPAAELPPAVVVQPSSRGQQRLDRAASLIARARENFDPLAVFDRIEATLQVLAETDDSYR